MTHGGEVDAIEPPAAEPAKVLRLAVMADELRHELRRDGLSDGALTRLELVYRTCVEELHGALSDDLAAELDRLVAPLPDVDRLGESELRIAESQLAGWLDGLRQQLQALALAEQAAALQRPQHDRRATTATSESPAPRRAGAGPPSDG